MRKIFVYKNDNKCPVNDFLEKAEEKIKNKFEFCLEYLKDDKHCFCEPYVRHFSGGRFSRLYEVRVMVLSKMVRVIFYEHDEEIVFLHAFYKKTLKDTRNALEVSLKILDSITDKDGAVLEKYREELKFND